MVSTFIWLKLKTGNADTDNDKLYDIIVRWYYPIRNKIHKLLSHNYFSCSSYKYDVLS